MYVGEEYRKWQSKTIILCANMQSLIKDLIGLKLIIRKSVILFTLQTFFGRNASRMLLVDCITVGSF